MAFEDVTDLSADVTISLGGTNKKTGKANPTKAEGYYLGKREVADKKKKSGISYIYFLQTPKGNLGVWGKTDLDNKMVGIVPGTMVRLTYDRMVETPNGPMYKYKVAQDKDNTIVVSGAESTSANSNDSTDAFNDEAEEIGDADEDQAPEEDEDALQAAALARAEQKRKVDALLNKSKSKN